MHFARSIDNDLKKTFWAAADKLRSNTDAAESKHFVFGLILLKYISDSLGEHRADLVDLISKIGFNGNKAKDVLGEVYEYYLGQFANVEGKKGGQFYTPAAVVTDLVVVLAPHSGKVNDPRCGSGGMFVQSEKFMESHGGRFWDISIYGPGGPAEVTRGYERFHSWGGIQFKRGTGAYH